MAASVPAAAGTRSNERERKRDSYSCKRSSRSSCRCRCLRLVAHGRTGGRRENRESIGAHRKACLTSNERMPMFRCALVSRRTQCLFSSLTTGRVCDRQRQQRLGSSSTSAWIDRCTRSRARLDGLDTECKSTRMHNIEVTLFITETNLYIFDWCLVRTACRTTDTHRK